MDNIDGFFGRTPISFSGYTGFLALLSLILLLAILRVIWRGLASRRWPSTQGRIHTSRLDAREVPSRGGRMTLYDPIITYEYRVDETDYTSSKINFGDLNPTHTLTWAKSVLETYPQNNSVEVFYNPRNPGDSVLHRNVPTWHHYVLLVVVLSVWALFTFTASIALYSRLTA